MSETWTNCSTPDCEFKVCTWLSAHQCYGCHFGLPMMTMEKYEAQPMLSEEEWAARHEALVMRRATEQEKGQG